jgi:hypothetical protein
MGWLAGNEWHELWDRSSLAGPQSSVGSPGEGAWLIVIGRRARQGGGVARKRRLPGLLSKQRADGETRLSVIGKRRKSPPHHHIMRPPPMAEAAKQKRLAMEAAFS